ncbi:MAG: hypothetical protein L0Y64_22795, partial [Myxococcaceae bacterium]|nr:hypothetical protein [Myxococcaceae bacterium]
LLTDAILAVAGAVLLVRGEPFGPFLLAFGVAGTAFGLVLVAGHYRVRATPVSIEQRWSVGVPLRTRDTPRAALEALTVEQETRYTKHGQYKLFVLSAVGPTTRLSVRSGRDVASVLAEAERLGTFLGLPVRDLRPTPEQLAAWKEPSSKAGLLLLGGVMLFALLAVVLLAIFG